MFEYLQDEWGGGRWTGRRSRQGMTAFSKIPQKGLSVGAENGPSSLPGLHSGEGETPDRGQRALDGFAEAFDLDPMDNRKPSMDLQLGRHK